jgi:hypothetical protein
MLRLFDDQRLILEYSSKERIDRAWDIELRGDSCEWV